MSLGESCSCMFVRVVRQQLRGCMIRASGRGAGGGGGGVRHVRVDLTCGLASGSSPSWFYTDRHVQTLD